MNKKVIIFSAPSGAILGSVRGRQEHSRRTSPEKIPVPGVFHIRHFQSSQRFRTRRRRVLFFLRAAVQGSHSQRRFRGIRRSIPRLILRDSPLRGGAHLGQRACHPLRYRCQRRSQSKADIRRQRHVRLCQAALNRRTAEKA